MAAYLGDKAGVRLFYTGRACNFEYMQPRPQVKSLLRLLTKSAPAKLFDAFHKGEFCSILKQLHATCDEAADDFPCPFLQALADFFSPENVLLGEGFSWIGRSAEKEIFTGHKTKFVAMLKRLVNPASVAVVLNRKALKDKIIELDANKKVQYKYELSHTLES